MTGPASVAGPSRGTAPVGVALVGAGRIARMFHLPLLAGQAGATLVAVVDPDEQARAAAGAAAPQAEVTASLAAALRRSDVTAVVVTVPTPGHADVAVAALEAGKHVYVEKPLSLDVAGASRVARAWHRGDRVAAVGHNFRFHPQYVAARDLLASGALGAPVAVRGVFSSAPRELPAWKRDRATGGGALLDLAVHHVDLVRWLLGTDVVAVTGSVTSRLSAADTAVLQLELADGPAVQLVATTSAAQGDRMEVMGSAATAHVDRMARRRLRVEPAGSSPGSAQRAVRTAGALLDGAAAVLDRLRPPPEPSFALSLAAFVRAAASGGGWSGADPDDGVAALAVVEAAERSSVSGAREAVVR